MVDIIKTLENEEIAKLGKSIPISRRIALRTSGVIATFSKIENGGYGRFECSRVFAR